MRSRPTAREQIQQMSISERVASDGCQVGGPLGARSDPVEVVHPPGSEGSVTLTSMPGRRQRRGPTCREDFAGCPDRRSVRDILKW